MAIFNYKARDKTGKLLSGSIYALDEIVVVKNLRQLGQTIISIEQESQFRLKLDQFVQRIKRVSFKDLLFFVRQLSTLLKSGIPLIAAINSIGEQTKNRTLKITLEKIAEDIEAGISLSDSLSKYPQVFSEFFVSMVKVGESAGILDSVLERLTQLLNQEMEIRSRIKSAMSYPVILVLVAVGIITFILATVIPKFVVIFETYEAKLPLSTTILLTASLIVRKTWYILLIAILAGFFWFKRYLRSEKGKYNFSSFLFRIPLFGQLYLKVIIAQFARTLGTLVKSGVPVLEALKVTEKTITNLMIKQVVQNVRGAISRGKSLSEPFKESGVFPILVIQMISVGEQTGKLDRMLLDVANFYDQEIDYAIRDTAAVLEPILLLIMGSGVAFIALSVLTPIFNLVKVFRH